MRVVRYVICDVFTDRALAGNPLAAFTDARALDGETMQALARELNLSESAFVLRPTTSEADARIRIFTPTAEIPFAGHPTLGVAFVLAGPLSRDVVRLETARGIIPVTLTREGGRIVFGWMIQPVPTVRRFADSAELLGALGVAASGLPVEIYDNGPSHVFVELASPEAVAGVRPDLSRLAAATTSSVSTFARAGARWKTRVFAPAAGVHEDPATGSAAGPLAVHLARHGRIAFGDQIVIDQGAEIGRPSTLHARALGSGDRIDRVEVGGSAVLVARGEFTVP
jgi:trans-2,3-dihydro-3-hydroxyanthranilate isomerase